MPTLPFLYNIVLEIVARAELLGPDETWGSRGRGWMTRALGENGEELKIGERIAISTT